MSEEFPFQVEFFHGIRLFFHSQFFGTPSSPTQSFANQTIIVTGSNVGLGLEAARHFYRLNCAKLILAVRTTSKGESAKEDIVRSVTHRTDADSIEVWPLDLTKTESVLAFAERVKKELPRVDALVENAGINSPTYSVAEGFESNIQVNALNTFLLALSLLPKLRETKVKFPDSSPHLEIVSSEAHRMTQFDEIKSPDLYQRLNDKSQFVEGNDRYSVSKLLEVLFVRELVSRLESTGSTNAPVTIDLVNPGLCKSDITRNMQGGFQIVVSILILLLGRSSEQGSRTLVHGASAGLQSHGQYLSDAQNQEVEKWIYGDVGKKAQKKVFEQTMKILESRKPGIGKAVGL